MAEDIVVDLMDEKIENHELSHEHGGHSECDVKIAALEERIRELESGHHIHDDEFEEAEEQPVIEEV